MVEEEEIFVTFPYKLTKNEGIDVKKTKVWFRRKKKSSLLQSNGV